MAAPKSFFYGWVVLVVAWFGYGLSLCPGYYSWSIVAPNILEDLEFSREQMGTIFGLFVFLLGAVAPVVGAAIQRFGTRFVMPLGCFVSGIGFLLTARVDSYAGFLISFAVLGGVGVGFASQVPSQTLAANWFSRRRAMAMGIILTAGGIVGKGVPYVDRYLLSVGDWRLVWTVVGCISIGLGIFTAIFVRNRPSDIGQLPDGDAPSAGVSSSTESGKDAAKVVAETPSITLRDAMKMPQFYVLCIAGMAVTMPYNVVALHGRLHFMDIAFDPMVVAGMIGTMALASVFGRLAGSLGDFFPPVVLLGLALTLMGVAMGVLFETRSQSVANFAIIIFALGHGVAYTSRYSVFPKFFGLGSFATLAGVMGFVGGVGGFVATRLAGTVYDQWGSYRAAFITIIVFQIAIGITCMLTRPSKVSTA